MGLKGRIFRGEGAGPRGNAVLAVADHPPIVSTLPVALVYESDSMLRFVVHDPTVMIELCGNIALAVVLNLAYLHSVKTCKVTTCAVAIVIKDCFLVYISPFVFGSSVQYSSAFYGLTVIGILQYMGIRIPR